MSLWKKYQIKNSKIQNNLIKKNQSESEFDESVSYQSHWYFFKSLPKIAHSYFPSIQVEKKMQSEQPSLQQPKNLEEVINNHK